MLPVQPLPRPAAAQDSSLTSYFGGFRVRPFMADTRAYMRGECGHLALAVHQQWPGSQIWNLGGSHFTVELPDGAFVDIRGKMTLEQAWNGLLGAQMTPLSREEVISELDTGVYRSGFYSASAEQRAATLMRKLLPPPAPRRRLRP